MSFLRRKLTYANAMATVAVFIALGGASYAAVKLPKNSVGTRQIKNNAVTGAKIRNRAVSGQKIDLSTLGTVPAASHAASADSAQNASHAARADSALDASHAASADSAGDAAALQGNPASSFMQGGGRFLTFHRELAVGASGVTVMSLPGIGRLTAECSMGTTYLRGGYKIVNESGAILDQTNHYGLGVDGGTVGNGESIGFAGQEYVDAVTVQVATRQTPSTVANLDLSFLKNGNVGCEMFGQATVAGGPRAAVVGGSVG
ncbi:MAG: hypothetical protein ACRDPE_13455 [Solirubrobacterales bacterium]